MCIFKVMLFVGLFGLSFFVEAGSYVEGRQVRSVFGSGVIKFGVNNPPSDTCDYYNRTFKFDSRTENGRTILSILLAAKMAGKDVNIWYSPSPKPGTSSENGCSIADMATINEIGID